eukprot:Phypoly_transcript_18712.p1 GENE.Phypoly_transcript_18712~~Phypoly_transcript_18712.p1  ORF type:complete len:188 (+),score=8.15 Phypoly_transcript_18712:43-564(+)
MTVGYFVTIDYDWHIFNIQKQSVAFCGEKLVYDYSINSLWCVNSDSLILVNISNPMEVSYSIWYQSPYYFSRKYSAAFDLQNGKYYTLTGNNQYVLSLISYNVITNTTMATQGKLIQDSLWFLDIIGNPAPCYGCVHGTCNDSTNTCTCSAGWQGNHCTISSSKTVYSASIAV